MKKLISILLAGVISLGLAVPSFAADADSVKRVYVSPTGDDRYEGETANNAVATLARASELAKELKADGSEVQVIMMEGVYVQEGNFELGAEDSGTADAPVIYRAAKDADVKLTTGKKLAADDFSESTETGNTSGIVYEVVLEDAGINAPSEYTPALLVIDGELQPIAESLADLEDGEYVVEDGVLYYAPEDYEVVGEIYLSDNYNEASVNTDLKNARATIKLDGVSYVKFENIDIFGGVGCAYMLDECDNVTIYGSNISAMCGWGVFTNLSTNISVIACDIGNLPGLANTQFWNCGGISINVSRCVDGTKLEGVAGGENAKVVNENNLIRNCNIHDYDTVYPASSTGISIGGMGTTVEHNVVRNAGGAGITFAGNDHNIINNRVIDVLKSQSDNGAIYGMRSWTDRGTLIKNNFIYWSTGNSDSYEPFEDESPQGLYGIYLDDMLSGITVEGNVIYNMQGGMMIGGGSDNTIINNIANGQIGMHYDARGAGSPYDNSKHFDEQSQYNGSIYKDVKNLIDPDYIEYYNLSTGTSNYYGEGYVESEWAAAYSGWTDMLDAIAAFDAAVADGEDRGTALKTLGTPRNVVIDGNLFFGDNLAADWADGLYDNYVRIDSITANVNTGANPAEYTYDVEVNGSEIETVLDDSYPATTAEMGIVAESYTPSYFETEYLANDGSRFTVIAALYNASGALKSITTTEDAYVYDGQIVGMDITLPENAENETGWFVKVMLWDSLQGMVPIASQSITIGK